jgi:putative phosphoesterase
VKIAVIADIHANLVALDAVIAELRQESPDAMVCLGDVAATGPQPHAVLDRMRELGGLAVMGNADLWMLNPHRQQDPGDDARRLEEIDLWCVEQLVPADLEMIQAFQPWLEIDLNKGHSLVCYHGSPKSSTERIATDTPQEELDRMLEGFQAAVMAGGHTHQAMLRVFNGSLIINPGSVGLPYVQVGGMLRNPAWAEYALVDNDHATLGIEFRRVSYSLEDLVQSVRDSGMPHADWWLKDWR